MKNQFAGTLVTLAMAAIASLVGANSLMAADGGGGNSEWRLYGNGADAQFYSTLKQVNDKNVGKLGLAWYVDLPTKAGLIGNPLIADGVVYQGGAIGRMYANDVRTGKQLWTFDAKVNFEGGTIATSMGALWTRGIALWEDKLYMATGDCRMVAVDRKTGQKAWDVVSCDKSDNYMQAGAPHVGGGKVFIGNSCIDGGGRRGFVTAFDAQTGKIKWRWYTVPGDPAKGYKPENKAMEVAAKTWGKEWKPTNGCGAVWDAITYDEKLNLVYLGVGGANPWNPEDRGEGATDELYASSIVALNADTGEYVWHYKLDPNDGWNFEPMNTVVADLPIKGKMRRVVMNAPKNGFLYVLDAKTGKFLSANHFVPVNWASRIDPTTGRPVYLPEGRWWEKPEGAVLSPGPLGAHNVYPMAYSPDTRLVYIPAMSVPTFMKQDRTMLVGGSYWDLYYQDEKLKAYGSLVAWDPLTQKERWSVRQQLPLNGGVLTTAGNLVFQGEGTGYFKAYRADTGELLWSYNISGTALAAASTVEIDGEQLIIVPSGNGGSSGTALTTVKYATCELCRGPAKLLAFKLGGTATLPPPVPPAPFVQPTVAKLPAELADEGKVEYARQSCETCHGMELLNAGSIPADLRRSQVVPKLEVFDTVVRAGAYRSLGMPLFDYLTDHQLQAIQAYIVNGSWKAYEDQNLKHPDKQ
jgi:PQQ-dependent dehydrogenase (methanol/ethanol family)